MKSAKDILRERSEFLANRTGKEKSVEVSREFVCFLLYPNRYAIEKKFVSEVLPLRDLTPLPGTPEFIMGIINIRGQIISLVNLKMIFKIPEKGLTEMNKVIILKNEKISFGLVVDNILEISGFSENSIAQFSIKSETESRFILGFSPGGAVVLDGEKILNSPDLLISG